MQYVSLIIGFEVCSLGMVRRKIRALPLMAHPRRAESYPLWRMAMIQSAFPRKFSKLKNTGTVPQTDTGDQVE